MVQKIIDTLNEQGISYSRWYTEDRLIEIDLGGQDRLYEFVSILKENIEEWVYTDLLDVKIEIDFAFERINIKY